MKLKWVVFSSFLLSTGSLLGWSALKGGPFQYFRILILGDSLTEGYGVDTEQAFPAVLEEKLQQMDSRVKVINGGASGSTSASGIRRLRWYEKTNPQVVVLALGSNDGLRGVKVEETQKNVEKVVEYAKKKAEMNLTDGIHPNVKGHEKIASNLLPFLVKHLDTSLAESKDREEKSK